MPAASDLTDQIAVPTRRQLLGMIGTMGGAAAMYQAMTALGHAAETQFTGPPVLSGARPGASVVVLGAGLAGLAAALELSRAGYSVQVLEYQDRAGGRNYSVRGGDRIVEVGGATQTCEFAPGNYINPGPWRIPHHHRTLLHYCKTLGVELEPFIQNNHNGLIHRSNAFGGQPQRYKELAVDFKGHVSELLGKALNDGALDGKVSAEDKEKLLVAMREWGVLDRNMAFTPSIALSGQRGYDIPPGGGLDPAPTASTPNGLADVLSSNVWTQMGFYFNYVMQTTMFQPKGGMDQIAAGFMRQIGAMVRLNTRVAKIAQDASGVTVDWTDNATGQTGQTKADWCVCTIPPPVLSQIELQASDALLAAVRAVPMNGQLKIGLEMRRRFWEEDYAIYGGHSFTDQAISQLSYPNDKFFQDGPAVLLGAFANGAGALQLTGMTPAERIEVALDQGSVFHPAEYRREFISGVSVPWSRMPWIQGCTSRWTDASRAQHYTNLVTMDGRVVLAGEHATYYGGWMEGSLLSALNAIEQLHQRATAA
ncbi:flavin monoamine oxidase family protein [Alteraurantiacibacter buctensis]|uniref:Tryptophan 2-monooxygenase n=1 Tax=Alteraurantiacibacter buctensis TaxID=1503981 RepID=A0A844YVQ3_9SPHN|nr:flavin monoamine oxidase family protein [Alteraurantiacibacter buctensis]MXO70998.1 NAD(P)-binding protein [Alteraurantiacibacter buctensis]